MGQDVRDLENLALNPTQKLTHVTFIASLNVPLVKLAESSNMRIVAVSENVFQKASSMMKIC